VVIAYEYIFPLVGAKSIEGAEGVQVEQVHGTAFYAKSGNFVVAGHALRKALQHDLVGLGHVRGDSWGYTHVTAHEVIDDYDVGFVKAEIPEAKALNWKFDELPMLADIHTVGFPFALDLERFRIRVRAFKGHIVSSSTFYDLPRNPRCYELSFACPRGLSGAPLCTQRPGRVVGLVIGNQSTEMLVYSDKEVQKEDGKPAKETERYEATQFGVAIQTSSLQDIESDILGGSVMEYLKSVELA